MMEDKLDLLEKRNSYLNNKLKKLEKNSPRSTFENRKISSKRRNKIQSFFNHQSNKKVSSFGLNNSNFKGKKLSCDQEDFFKTKESNLEMSL